MNSHPTVAQIRESLERSGYLMEQRIAPLLERRGYMVTPNQEYEDPDTGKSREIDLHALRLEFLLREHYDDMLNSTVIASCKNNYLPIVLFTHRNRLRGIAEAMSISKAGFPLTVERSYGEQSIEPFLGLGDSHHFYKATRIARQYCRIKEVKAGRDTQYIADHGDLRTDIDSLIKAVNAEILEYKPTPECLRDLQASKKEDDGINLNFIYPVVILSGELYECRQAKKEATIRASNHIVYVRRVESRVLKGEFFIDFIRESYLGRYLRQLDQEFQFIHKRLKSNRNQLRRNSMREQRALAAKQPL